MRKKLTFLTQVWDITSGKCINTFDLHDSPVLTIKFNPFDLTLATGSADKTVKYWDLDKFGLVRKLQEMYEKELEDSLFESR